MSGIIGVFVLLTACLALFLAGLHARLAWLDGFHTHGMVWPARILVRLRCRSYSQNGQDLAVLRMLGDLRGGFFVELGASNGVISNNSLMLEQRCGWRGICIEADPWFHAQLVRNRTGPCVHACVDSEPGEVLFTAAGATGGIVDRDTDNAVAQAGADTLTVRTRALQDILDEQGAPAVIDYLSLDVEGAEYRVLRKFPFERYRFRVMMIERAAGALHDLLVQTGYERVGRIGEDQVYVWPSEGLPAKARAALA